MEFHIMTLFPDMVMGGLSASITGRAMDKGLLSVEAVDIRDYADNKNRHVDDYTYGGGAGMLMQAQPVVDCYESIEAAIRERRPEVTPHVIYMTPTGKPFTQADAERLSKMDCLVLLCGHYEGIDARATELIVDEEISLGDFVLTGGELPAMVVVDAVSRLIPGVLGSDESAVYESFYNGLLEYPQYTRPPVYRDMEVPEVLLSGNHKLIEDWRFDQSLAITKEKRPDLYEAYVEEHKEELAARARKKK